MENLIREGKDNIEFLKVKNILNTLIKNKRIHETIQYFVRDTERKMDNFNNL